MWSSAAVKVAVGWLAEVTTLKPFDLFDRHEKMLTAPNTTSTACQLKTDVGGTDKSLAADWFEQNKPSQNKQETADMNLISWKKKANQSDTPAKLWHLCTEKFFLFIDRHIHWYSYIYDYLKSALQMYWSDCIYHIGILCSVSEWDCVGVGWTVGNVGVRFWRENDECMEWKRQRDLCCMAEYVACA